MDRILIIDQTNEFIRNYLVNPTISTNGINIGGIVGVLRCLQKYIREFKPSMVISCWDGPGGSLRKRAINKNYKDGRKPPKLNRFVNVLSDEEEKNNKIWQIVRTTEFLEDLPIHQFMVDNVEGDDIIAFVTQLEMFVSYQKCIISSDKDFIQLLDNRTVLYRPIQKVFLHQKNVVGEYGIHPNNFCMARSIAGDVSDCLPGVNGVGLKTIAKRFPFLKEEKNYYIGDVQKYCKEQITAGSKLKVYQDVCSCYDRIKENYTLMQLFSPLISVQEKDKIKSALHNKKLDFHQSKFQAKMIQDGFDIDFDFDTLFQWSRKVASK